MTSVLKSDERDALLDYISKYAEDDTLVRVVEEIKEHREYVRNSMISIGKYIGLHKTSASSSSSAPQSTPVAELVAEPVIEPPGVAASRIGSETKGLILRKLQAPSTGEEVNLFLNRPKSKLQDTQGLLKLLCERGDVKFIDGKYHCKG